MKTLKKPKNFIGMIDALIQLAEKGELNKSVNEDGSCQYRSPDGCRCFIGLFIPDELYRPCYEGCPIEELTEKQLEDFFQSIEGAFVNRLEQLQFIHDSAAHNHNITNKEEFNREVLVELLRLRKEVGKEMQKTISGENEV